ncbi:MAG TPA: DUF4337 family protein [Acetobacteraceae bacterium]|nr:DUF4337 family protein [Acetobacteraceae bacterium]
MSETVEHAREGIAEAHEAHAHGDAEARWIAVIIAVLAALLALCEMGEKTALATWMTTHISVSDDYNFYQAKNLRAAVLGSEIDMLQSLPNQSDPAIQQRIEAAKQQQARLRDDDRTQGMKQLLALAEQEKTTRERYEHLTHHLETVVGGLQIAIVLASVSIVTRMRWLARGGFALGLAMAVYGGLLWTGVV